MASGSPPKVHIFTNPKIEPPRIRIAPRRETGLMNQRIGLRAGGHQETIAADNGRIGHFRKNFSATAQLVVTAKQ